MAKAEQARGARYASPKAARYQKRRLARLRRRHEKRDPEGAPTTQRGYMRGWAD